MNPSKITALASEMRSASSGVGWPAMPSIFFWNEPR